MGGKWGQGTKFGAGVLESTFKLNSVVAAATVMVLSTKGLSSFNKQHATELRINGTPKNS